MIDWKVLASAFIALFVVSVVLLGVFGSGGLSGAIDTIKEWFGSSPFGGLLPKESGSRFVEMVLRPSNITLNPKDDVIIYTGVMNITGFRGTIDLDFRKNSVLLSESESGLEIHLTAEGTKIKGIKLDELTLKNSGFMIMPNVTAENGTLKIMNFYGDGKVKGNGIELRGNLSRLSALIGSLSWELS